MAINGKRKNLIVDLYKQQWIIQMVLCAFGNNLKFNNNNNKKIYSQIQKKPYLQHTYSNRIGGDVSESGVFTSSEVTSASPRRYSDCTSPAANDVYK